jgi:signal transduction histidine kinase
MNPLPRLLGLSLLVVLAALTAMLAGPAVSAFTEHPATTPAKHTSPSNALTTLPQRAALPLASLAFVLAAGLLISLALRPPRSAESTTPLANARLENSALAKLARSSVAQGEELAQERDNRQRAEENALLNQQLLNRSLEEQIRLGRDLHDGVIQSLYAAGLVIESARTLSKTDPVEADRRLVQLLQTLNQTIRDVRTYIVGLAPENLRQASFGQALDSLVTELGAGREVHFDLKIDDSASSQLSPAQATEGLHVAREAISNSLRHGKATRITVRLHPGEGAVCLLVQDNGSGFDAARSKRSGHGLRNIQARAADLGASVRVESRVNEGTRVLLTFPLASVEEGQT